MSMNSDDEQSYINYLREIDLDRSGIPRDLKGTRQLPFSRSSFYLYEGREFASWRLRIAIFLTCNWLHPLEGLFLHSYIYRRMLTMQFDRPIIQTPDLPP